MAHFAELDENNIVLQVTVVNNSDILDENGNESEEIGIQFNKNLLGQDTKWVQTSYNSNFRYKKWRPPFPKPMTTHQYEWDESISDWKQVEGSEGERSWVLDLIDNQSNT